MRIRIRVLMNKNGPRHPLRTFKLQEKPSPLKREYPALQNIKFLHFFIFVGDFYPCGSRPRRLKSVRIRINTFKYCTFHRVDDTSLPGPGLFFVVAGSWRASTMPFLRSLHPPPSRPRQIENRLICKYFKNLPHVSRFALACNSSEKIIEPIQSRCAMLRFSKLSDSQVNIFTSTCRLIDRVK